MSHQSIGGHDTAVLRRLAERVAEIAADPAQEERADLWLRTNRLERVRPPINVHLEESCWPEVLPDADFETSHPEARMYETMLRRTIWEWEHLADDRLTEAVVEYPVAVHDSGIGVVARKVYAGGPTSACEYVPAVVDESDIDSIELPELTLDREQTERDRELVERVFAGILEPVPGPRYDVGRFDLIDRWSELRGIEQMYLDMVERKTARYTVVSPLRLGALLQGLTPDDRFERAGLDLGAAFQIRDDVLNLLPDEGAYGKEFAGDLYEGKRTLILAHALQTLSQADGQRLIDLLSQPRPVMQEAHIKEALELIHTTDAIAYAQGVAESKAERGLTLLSDALESVPNLAGAASLLTLLETLANRKA